MAKETTKNTKQNSHPHLRTSIGNSVNTRVTSKHKRVKPYRGQGK